MNLKPNRLKVIASVIAWIIVDLILAGTTVCVSLIPGGCPPFYSYMISPLHLGFSFIAFVIVYAAFSLVQKGTKRAAAK
jgi:hypothetical protein